MSFGLNKLSRSVCFLSNTLVVIAILLEKLYSSSFLCGKSVELGSTLLRFDKAVAYSLSFSVLKWLVSIPICTPVLDILVMLLALLILILTKSSSVFSILTIGDFFGAKREVDCFFCFSLIPRSIFNDDYEPLNLTLTSFILIAFLAYSGICY